MKKVISVLVICVLACQSKIQTPLFKDMAEKSDVEIHLSNYGLDSVPNDIGLLKRAKRLYISRDSVAGWNVYPPLSALDKHGTHPPFRRLPDAITKLKNLTTLSLVDLDLVTLPDNLGRLENLDTLVLYMNKLTIANELAKLKQLKKLKYLGLFGNNLTLNDLKELKEAIPDITTSPEIR